MFVNVFYLSPTLGDEDKKDFANFEKIVETPKYMFAALNVAYDS